MKQLIIYSVCAFFVLLAFGTNLLAGPNAVYDSLVNQGIRLDNGKTVTFQEPVMADGLTASAQTKVLEQVGPKNKNLLKLFEDADQTDKGNTQQIDEKGANTNSSIGRRIDLYFVAKGKLATLASDGFVKEQLNSGKQNSIDFFTNNELKERKLSVTDTQNSKERFAHALLTPDDLLGEVQVTGCGHGVETLTPESILIAFKMDPQFDKDPKYPNQYQKAKTDKNGNIVLESPKHYLGFAGYAKITKLQGAVDKLFVEYHVIYDEPFEWFNGTTSLVSKLTINFTQSIRKFRRNILKYEQEHPSPGGSAPATQAALQSTANKP